MENYFLSACIAESYKKSVAHRLQPECLRARPRERERRRERGKRGSRFCVDGSGQAARDRQQGREGCASEGNGARVDQRGSARGWPQGRNGESSSEAAAV